MPSITEEVQTLVEQGNTEAALETFANWLRTEQSFALNEVILLRSRYEQVERELGLDLISSEDAARAYNQISFSLLNLAQSVERGQSGFVAPQTPPNRKGWLIAGAGALLIIVLLMFVLKVLLPSRELPDTRQDTQSNKSSDANIQFPQGKEASLQVLDAKVTYTILEAIAEPYNPENQKITVKIRCFLKGRYGMNFWESSFRLIANELPYAAQGGLNELVENESFKDGEVYFLIPKELRKADLKMTFFDEYTVLPLQW